MATNYTDLDTLFITGGGGGGSTTFSGDISGTSSGPQTVIGMQGRPIAGTAPTNGQAMAWSVANSRWEPTTISGGGGAPTTATYLTLSLDGTLSNERVLTADTNVSFVDGGPGGTLTINSTGGGSFTAGGDLSGTTSSQVVIRINGATVPAAGALTTGNAPYVSGTSALTYSALNLAGGSGWVTGVLPSANQAAQTLGGDASGTTAAVVNARVNGTTYPAGGALVTGNSAYVSGTSATTYSALNLAGGSGWVTGVLPSANMFQATTGASGAVRLTADLAGTAAAPVVARVNGATYPAGGALVTGNSAYVSGVSATTYSALNLAGGSGWVTGILPTANQAAQTMTGDVSGTTAANVVNKINGVTVTGVPSAGNVLTAASSTTAAWTNLPPASTSVAGIVQLAQDLAGTSTAPTVSAITGISGLATIRCASVTNTSTAKVTPTTVLVGTTNTTNATLTTIYTYPLTNNATTKVMASIEGVRDTNAQAASYELAVTVRANGGVYQFVGSLSKFAVEDDPDWDCTLALSGSNLLVQVTGKAATNVSWGGEFSARVRTY